MFNNCSSLDELNLALEDIHRAFEMNKEEIRFEAHLNILKTVIEEKQHSETERMLHLFSNTKYAFNKIKEKNLNIEDFVYAFYESVETNYEILEDMRLKYRYAIKFHSESANEKQIEIAYREFENYMDVYDKFKWFYSFDNNKKLNSVKNLLSDEDK